MLGACLIFIAGLSGYFLGRLSYCFMFLSVSDEDFFILFLHLMYHRMCLKDKKKNKK